MEILGFIAVGIVVAVAIPWIIYFASGKNK